MQQILGRARAATSKARKEEILKNSGTHNLEHFLWEFAFSDPYKAVSYDPLHYHAIGIFGKHGWVLILQVLQDLKVAGKFNKLCVELFLSTSLLLTLWLCIVWPNFLDGPG
jgi:hypothetical protein